LIGLARCDALFLLTFLRLGRHREEPVGCGTIGGVSVETTHTEVAPAAPGDRVGLAGLAAAVLPEGWDERALEAELVRPGAGVWVARAGSDICGGVIARSSGAEVELLWLAVAEPARRSGTGARLVGAVVTWAHASAASVVLEVRSSNRAARQLYARAGFVVVGRRPRYYRDGEDALLLACAPPEEATP
jgi:ribosomal-protein-alanine N-acetyltransferase